MDLRNRRNQRALLWFGFGTQISQRTQMDLITGNQAILYHVQLVWNSNRVEAHFPDFLKQLFEEFDVAFPEF